MFLLLHFEVEGPPNSHIWVTFDLSTKVMGLKINSRSYVDFGISDFFKIFQYYYILKFNVGHLGMLEALMYVTFDLLID